MSVSKSFLNEYCKNLKKKQSSPSAPLSVKELRKHYKQHAVKTFPSRFLHATPAPQRPPHMKKQSAKIMKQNLLVEAYKAEIRHWCGIVYGNQNILQKRLRKFEKSCYKRKTFMASCKPSYVFFLSSRVTKSLT